MPSQVTNYDGSITASLQQLVYPQTVEEIQAILRDPVTYPSPVCAVDEIKLIIAPVLLGDGLRLFGDSPTEERWDLKNVAAYKNGFVELSYVAREHQKISTS